MVPRHAQDVGQILVEAQAELRSIRDSLAEDGGRGPSADKLQAVVEKVEAELKLKAEAVLSTAQHSTPSTLPTLGSFNFRAPPGGSIGEPSADAASMHGTSRSLPRPRLQLPPRSSSADHKSTRVGAKFAAAQRFEMALTNPNAARSRAYLTERFGIKQPSRKSLPRAAGKRPANPSRPLKAQTVGSLGTLDGATRRDPHARPPIAPSDVAAGLYSLVNRGLLPPHIDLTGAMCRQPAPVAQAPSQFHDFKEQFAQHNSAAYISPFGFNLANTRLDLLSDVGQTLADRKALEEHMPPPRLVALEASRPPPTVNVESALPAPPPAEADTQAQEAREFEELMDTFSLHHYIIRHGMTLDTTPEFISRTAVRTSGDAGDAHGR